MKFPIEAEPLPQGVPLKSHIRSLKKEIYQAKKKFEKIEDELQKLKRYYFATTIEVTHLCQVHKKDAMDYINKKHHLTEEPESVKKLGSDKAWTLMAEASSLEVELKVA